MRTEYVSEEIIALQKVLDQKCYWWVLINNVFLCTHIKGERMDIKLPLPVIQNCQERRRWDFKYMKRKEHDDEEIARCKAIWSGLVEAIQERFQRINAGEPTVEEEFKAGILFEDGKYGLKYKEKWPL